MPLEMPIRHIAMQVGLGACLSLCASWNSRRAADPNAVRAVQLLRHFGRSASVGQDGEATCTRLAGPLGVEKVMRSVHGALIDVDGTLVDSNLAHACAWVEAFAASGIRLPIDRVRPLIGKGGDKLLPELTGLAADSEKGQGISRAREAIFLRDFLPLLRAFPCVPELLARMKADGLRLAIASSAKEQELHALLRICGADKFIEAKTSSDDTENSKPDPDIVEAALKKTHLSPAEALLLGDTPYDIAAGQKAGVGVIALRCGGWSDSDLRGARAIYDDVADLLDHYAESPFGERT